MIWAGVLIGLVVCVFFFSRFSSLKSRRLKMEELVQGLFAWFGIMLQNGVPPHVRPYQSG